MALITTSGSIPFSFASASIVCCRGFDILKFHFQVRARNHGIGYPVPAAIVAVNEDVSALDPRQRSFAERLSVDRLPHDNLRSPPHETPIIVGLTEGPIKPG